MTPTIPVRENPGSPETPVEAVDPANPQDVDFAELYPQRPIGEDALPTAQPVTKVTQRAPIGRGISVREFVDGQLANNR